MPSRKEHRHHSRFFGWTQHRKRNPATPHPAQAALDAADQPTTPTPPGSLYRTGVTLAELLPGQCGTIRRFLGSTQTRLRLLEMGLTVGTHVKALRIAAFGGPLDLLVRGYQLSLRREEAALIWLGEEDDEIEPEA